MTETARVYLIAPGVSPIVREVQEMGLDAGLPHPYPAEGENLIRYARHADIVRDGMAAGDTPDDRHNVPLGLKIVHDSGNGHVAASDAHMDPHPQFAHGAAHRRLQLDILGIGNIWICHVAPPWLREHGSS